MYLQGNEVQRVVTTREFNDGEREFFKFYYGIQGSFYTDLFHTIGHADRGHLHRLSVAYPLEVAAFESWRQGDLVNRLAKFLGRPAPEGKALPVKTIDEGGNVVG